MNSGLFQRKTLLTIVGLVAMAMSGSNVSAAEPEAAETPAEQTADDQGADAEPAAAEDHQPAAEVFIPTEEISEDFAVSFPVDI